MGNPLHAGIAVARLTADLMDSGITIRVVEDFDSFWTANEESGRSALTPVFDVRWGPVSDAFWIEGRLDDGSLAHFQAARRMRLGSQTLQAHFHYCRLLYCTVGIGIEPALSTALAADFTRGLSGDVVYNGEVWVSPRLRGKGVGPLGVKLTMLLSLIRWRPDWMIALTLPGVTSSAAFCRKLGYSHFEDVAFRWNDADGEIVRDEGLCWADRQELYQLAAEESDLEVCGRFYEAREAVAVG